MKPWNNQRLFVLMTVLVTAMVFAACSSEQKSDAQTAQDDTSKQTTYGKAVDDAKTVVASLNNPKEGFDPVCYMAINEDAVVVTMDDGKKYGFCSANCGDKFKLDPAKYLASTDGEDHSGHDH
jgi:YHS domain-containing protein